MTDSVDAQMRCVACVDALRDRGWVQYPHTIWTMSAEISLSGASCTKMGAVVVASYTTTAFPGGNAIHDGLCRCANAIRGLRGGIA